MAIHDLWSFDNAPVGTNLSQASTANITGTTNSTNPYYYYTGNPGMIYPTVGASQSVAVTSDGFLTFQRNASGYSNPMLFMGSQVQNWTTSTKFWIGFRTKASYATVPTQTGTVLLAQQSYASGNYNKVVTDGDLGSIPANTEVYVEVYIDSVANTYSVYVNGALVRTTTATYITSATEWAIDCSNLGGPPGNSTRGYRDFYFLDVDSTDTNRLGPIRSAPATLSNISGSEWTLNSAADLPTALTTALQNPPSTTPSASSPADFQPIKANLNTSSSSPIIAVQAAISTFGDAGNNALGLVLSQGGNQADLGRVVPPISANQFNQRWAIQRKAPDGSAWSAAKVSATQAILTPAQVKTLLLTHFDGAVTDTSALEVVTGTQMPLSGGATLTTTTKVFGSAAFQGSASNAASCITAGTDDKFILNNDFTIECFFIPNAADISGESIPFSKGPGSYLDLYHNTWYLSMGASNVHLVNGVAANLVAGTTYHIALTRSGTLLTIWVNGVAVATANSSLPWGITGNNMNFGNYYINGYSVKGVLDEARISNIARYTSTFTPPSAPFVVD
ncbi:hypothetical protein [Burkholderia phage FLC9]|nr:hypothetical protein [Burkholderia phage FLC9]